MDWLKAQWEKLVVLLAFIAATLFALSQQKESIKEERQELEKKVSEVEGRIKQKQEQVTELDKAVKEAEEAKSEVDDSWDELVSRHREKQASITPTEGLDSSCSQEIE